MTTTVTPTVLRIPLWGSPCGVCGLPATVMDIVGGWTRTWHPKPAGAATARYCDVGIRPVRNEGDQE